jgi:hypothetical protein
MLCAMTDTTSTTMPDEQRTAILNREVAKHASRGWTVSSVSGSQAVLQRNKKIGFFWNFVLTLLTGGLWLIVVIVKVVNRKQQSLILTVDAYGRMSRR